MTTSDRELDARLDALTREAEPDDRTWRRIEQRLRPRRRAPLAAIAAAVVIGLGTLIVAQFPFGGDEVSRDRLLVQAEVRAMAASAPDETALQRTNSPEELMQAWQENRDAIEELERALERDPDNRLLLEFLSEARLRQARLVQQGMTTTERSMKL
ncbi:MAG: hypothetical protein ACNS61_01400 [Candidatus Wenzhouxiangella sp. M2_3B_020]